MASDFVGLDPDHQGLESFEINESDESQISRRKGWRVVRSLDVERSPTKR
jgi:hypothetical protein